MRKNLGPVTSKSLLPGMNAAGDDERMSMKEVAKLFGIRHSAARIEKVLGLKPIDEVFQGRKTFRAYSRAQVTALKAKMDEDAREREAAFQKAMGNVGKELTPPQVPTDSTLARQTFGVLCEIRDSLRRLEGASA